LTKGNHSGNPNNDAVSLESYSSQTVKHIYGMPARTHSKRLDAHELQQREEPTTAHLAWLWKNGASRLLSLLFESRVGHPGSGGYSRPEVRPRVHPIASVQNGRKRLPADP